MSEFASIYSMALGSASDGHRCRTQSGGSPVRLGVTVPMGTAALVENLTEVFAPRFGHPPWRGTGLCAEKRFYLVGRCLGWLLFWYINQLVE